MENKEKDYPQNRFEFSLFVNENLICKRNFKINWFNESSFCTLDAKEKVDEIVQLIKDDLASKSRIYTWHYYNEEYAETEENEFNAPLLEPWECTFKFVITDNGTEVLSKIWDGYAYPRRVRDNIDLTNRFVNLNGIKTDINKLDVVRLPFDAYIEAVMIRGKEDLVYQIIQKICQVCSPERISFDDGTLVKEGAYLSDLDYISSDVYRTLDENGNVVDSKYYAFSKNKRFMKMSSDWGGAVAEKTKHYFDVECGRFFNERFKKFN